jgi:hypothetical protein
VVEPSASTSSTIRVSSPAVISPKNAYRSSPDPSAT